MANATIQPLVPSFQFVDEDGKLTNAAYDFLFNMFKRVGGSVVLFDAEDLAVLNLTQGEASAAIQKLADSFKFYILEKLLETAPSAQAPDPALIEPVYSAKPFYNDPTFGLEQFVFSNSSNYIDWTRPGTIGSAVPNTGVFTTVNKVTITQPASSATLTIADGKTFTVNQTMTLTGVSGKTLTLDKSLEFDGTDGTKMTFPSTNATIARTDAGQTFTGSQVITGALDLGANSTLTANATYYRGVTSGGTTVRLLGINAGNSVFVGPIDTATGMSSVFYGISSSVTTQYIYAAGAAVITATSTGAAITGSVSTTDPTSGAGPLWKLGTKKTTVGLTMSTTDYVEISIAGTIYKLATVS